MEDINYWNSSITVGENEKYNIDGLNIWAYKWRDTGEYFFKKEPVRQNNFKISVYEIENEGKFIKFGAIEVSSNAWIIYTNYK
jgi:hypothetical protein